MVFTLICLGVFHVKSVPHLFLLSQIIVAIRSIPLPRAQQLVSEPSDILFRICFKNNMAAKFEIEKFNGKNFSLWKLKVKAILRKDNCLAAISERPVDFTDDKKWSEMNEDAMADLYLSIADGVLSSIEEKKTAKEIWDHLNRLYEAKSLHNKIFLKRKRRGYNYTCISHHKYS